MLIVFCILLYLISIIVATYIGIVYLNLTTDPEETFRTDYSREYVLNSNIDTCKFLSFIWPVVLIFLIFSYFCRLLEQSANKTSALIKDKICSCNKTKEKEGKSE
jgi:biotin transporter BioY